MTINAVIQFDEKSWKTALSQLGAQRTIQAGQQIYEQGGEALYAFRVESGLGCLTKLLSDGRRQIIRFLHPGDYFGFEELDDHAFGVHALGPMVVARFSKKRVAELAETDRLAARYLREMAFEAVAKAYDRLVILGRCSAMERVASFLLQMLERSRGGSRIALGMSRTDIADFLGLTTETVSRTFTQLRAAGAIELLDPQHLVVVDRDLLVAYAEDNGASDGWGPRPPFTHKPVAAALSAAVV